jgi:hypothetical protein
MERKSCSLSKEMPEPQRKIRGRKNWRNYFSKVVKIWNSEENPEDEKVDCICSGVQSEGQTLCCDKTCEEF